MGLPVRVLLGALPVVLQLSSRCDGRLQIQERAARFPCALLCLHDFLRCWPLFLDLVRHHELLAARRRSSECKTSAS
jgi:hypothetical protein